MKRPTHWVGFFFARSNKYAESGSFGKHEIDELSFIYSYSYSSDANAGAI